jgi:hypothetical protein
MGPKTMGEGVGDRAAVMHAAKCRSIYYNLVACHSSQHSTDIMASAFIRELFETTRCDDVANFSKCREDFRKFISNSEGPERLSRILRYKETEEDEKRAVQACFHYSNWHRANLIRALDLRDWIYYHTIGRSERGLVVFGLSGGGCAGLKAANASFRWLRNGGYKK